MFPWDFWPKLFMLDRQPASAAEAKRIVAAKNAAARERKAEREAEHARFSREDLPELERKAREGARERGTTSARLDVSAIYKARRGEARG